MNSIEMALFALEQRYEEGLLFSADFSQAVTSCLAGRHCSEYDLRVGLSAKAIFRVTESINVMKSASLCSEPVISVDGSGKIYDYTENIPKFLALADSWESAGWIQRVTSEYGNQEWAVV